MTWLGCQLKDGPVQCMDDTLSSHTICGTTNKENFSHAIISVTIKLEVWLWQVMLM